MNSVVGSRVCRSWVWILTCGALALQFSGHGALSLHFRSASQQVYEIWQSVDATQWVPLDLSVAGTGGQVVIMPVEFGL
ncbi:MAG: hypothetical protein IT581_10705 [Verrucomicrobiales bacterium]|nr:hypothetical protein [Verrucomicrobiales bacterium]